MVRNTQQPAVAYASGIAYHPNGAIQRFTYGNGLVQTMTQNARQLPARVTSTGNALDFAYGYDRNGNPVQIDDHVTGTPTLQHRTLEYDGLDRLTRAVSPAFGGSDHTHRFGYDALDNLTSWTQAGVKDYAEYLYDARNRLTSIRNSSGATVVGLEYDPQGNLRNKNGQQFHFEIGNRLRGVSTGKTYLYDGLGRREHRSGQPVHQCGRHRSALEARDRDQHGRQGLLARQRVHRAAVEIGEVRRGLAACLRDGR